MPNTTDDDLDQLLDSALDDFEKIEISRSSKHDNDSVAAPSPSSRDELEGAVSSISDEYAKATASGLSQGLMKSAPSFAPTSSQATSESGFRETPALGLGLGMPSLLPDKKRHIRKAAPSLSPENLSKGTPSGPVENQLTDTIEILARQTRQTVQNLEQKKANTENGEELDEAMIENFVKQFEEMGSSQDVQSLMDSVMKQLLSKEVLYSPMLEIGQKYPQWLEENKSKLSEEELKRYQQQYTCIRELCVTYESTPDDFQKIVDLMQKMQDCGQPPAEIVKQLAPGVELGEDGIPILPDLLGGNVSGGQFPPNCSIM